MRHSITPTRTSRAFSTTLATVATALLTFGSAEAQVVPSPYEFIDTQHDLEVFVGFAAEDRGSLELGPGGGPFLGGRYGIRISGPLALEGTGYLLPTDRLVWNPTATDPFEEPLGESSLVLGVVEARARLTITGDRTWHGLAPHLTGGAGMAVSFEGTAEVENEAGLTPQERYTFGPAFIAAAGAGTRWLPFDRLGFRVDANLNLWRVSTPPGFMALETEDRPIPETEWAGVGSVTVGGSFRF